MDHVILGNSIASWLLAAAVVVAAVVAVKLVAWLSRRFVEPMVARTRNGVDNIIYYSLIAPLKLGIILLGIWIALDKLVYPSSWGIYVDRAFTIMIVLDVTWVFARLSSMLLERMWRRHDTSPTRKMMPVAARAADRDMDPGRGDGIEQRGGQYRRAVGYARYRRYSHSAGGAGYDQECLRRLYDLHGQAFRHRRFDKRQRRRGARWST